jgi:hypothetical protein
MRPAKHLPRERGYAMAFWCIVLATVVAPLMSLVIDINRAMYVRTHLQAAADAACQAAAQALDVPNFNASGPGGRIDPGHARSQANREFAGAIVDKGLVQYGPNLGIAFTSTHANCTATASVTHFVAITPPMNVKVLSTSEMRVGVQ